MNTLHTLNIIEKPKLGVCRDNDVAHGFSSVECVTFRALLVNQHRQIAIKDFFKTKFSNLIEESYKP